MRKVIETMTLRLIGGDLTVMQDRVRRGEHFADLASSWMHDRGEVDADGCMKALSSRRHALDIGCLSSHLIIHQKVGKAYRQMLERGEWELIGFEGTGLPLIYGNDFIFSSGKVCFLSEGECAPRFSFWGGDPCKYTEREDIEWTDAVLESVEGELLLSLSVMEKGEDAFDRACGIRFSPDNFCVVSGETTGVAQYPGEDIIKIVRKMEMLPPEKKMGRYEEFLRTVMDEVALIVGFLGRKEGRRTLFVTEYIVDDSEELLRDHPDPFWMTQAWRVFLVLLRELCDKYGSEAIIVRNGLALECCPVCSSEEIYVLDHDLVCTACSSRTELDEAAAINLMKIGRAVIEDRSISRVKEAMEE